MVGGHISTGGQTCINVTVYVVLLHTVTVIDNSVVTVQLHQLCPQPAW